MDGVKRTLEVARHEYEQQWQRLAAKIRPLLTEADPIAVINLATANARDDFLENDRFRHYRRHLDARTTLGGDRARRLVVKDGVYELSDRNGLAQELVNHELAEALSARRGQFDTVVELGSGWGSNLFLLHAELERRGKPELEYVACELSDGGRRLTEEIAATMEGMILSVREFDYYRPDLGFLEGRNVLFFSVHSIEQIPCLPSEVIEEMICRPASCVAFHFEPVGWQLDGDLVRKRELGAPVPSRFERLQHRLSELRSRIQGKLRLPRASCGFPGIQVMPNELHDRQRVRKNAAAWSGARDYNRNLIPLLRQLESEGRLEISRLEPDTAGDNPFNPASLVHWLPRRTEPRSPDTSADPGDGPGVPSRPETGCGAPQ